jgi:hypothetical protein
MFWIHDGELFNYRNWPHLRLSRATNELINELLEHSNAAVCFLRLPLAHGHNPYAGANLEMIDHVKTIQIIIGALAARVWRKHKHVTFCLGVARLGQG